MADYDNKNKEESVDGLTIDQRALFIMNKLIKDGGLSPLASAAITGMFWAESGLDPHIVDKTSLDQEKEKSEVGQGISQWAHGRVEEFRKWYKEEHGQDKCPIDSDLGSQIEFTLYEIGKRGKLMEILNSSNDIREVVDAILRGYEVGGVSSFSSIKEIDRLYPIGGYESLMKVRINCAERSLHILKNSPMIE